MTLPNGKIIHSTHTCNLDIPWLPAEMTEHIVPGLTQFSLISTRQFCDAGCKVIFDKEECRICYKYKKRLVLSGKRDRKSGLWKLPINPTATSPSLTLDPLDLQHSIPLQRLSIGQEEFITGLISRWFLIFLGGSDLNLNVCTVMRLESAYICPSFSLGNEAYPNLL